MRRYYEYIELAIIAANDLLVVSLIGARDLIAYRRCIDNEYWTMVLLIAFLVILIWFD